MPSLEDELKDVMSRREAFLHMEQEASMRREMCDKDIQRLRRLIREREKDKLPLATRPGDWTESK